MIQMSRYDVFDKWRIVCRSWAGETIDVGLDRHGDPLLPRWQEGALWGANRYCRDFVRLKFEALALPKSDDGAEDQSEFNKAAARLLEEIGYDELRQRCLRLLDMMRTTGNIDSTGELPPPIAQRLKQVIELGAVQGLRYTRDVGEIPDIETLRQEARSFPVVELQRKRKILSLFSARYYGPADVIHIYDASPDEVTLVDMDGECLEVMQRIYPKEWKFITADYKDFLSQAKVQQLQYDLVVADPWGAQCREVSFDMLPAIMAHAKTYIAHYLWDMFDELGVGRDDLAALSRAIAQRTGVNVTVTGTTQRSVLNCWVVMHRGDVAR